MRTTFRASSPMNAFRSSLRTMRRKNRISRCWRVPFGKKWSWRKANRRMLIVFSPLWKGTRISRSSRPASSMSSWRKSSSMRPATRRARIGRRRSTFTTRASEPWKCRKSRHQWKNEKTVQPKLYRSLFPHDVFLSGAAFAGFLFCVLFIWHQLTWKPGTCWLRPFPRRYRRASC